MAPIPPDMESDLSILMPLCVKDSPEEAGTVADNGEEATRPGARAIIGSREVPIRPSILCKRGSRYRDSLPRMLESLARRTLR